MPLPRHTLLLALLGVILSACRPTLADTLHRPLAGPLELFESGLYWLQDQTGSADLRDPAALLSEMQDVAARQFDFGELALRVGGVRYLRLDLLARSHYQNGLRDRLFTELARVSGLYDGLMPRYAFLPPVRLGPWRWMVGVRVIRRQFPSQALYFHFEQRPQGWRIVDVSLDGQLFSDHLRRRP